MRQSRRDKAAEQIADILERHGVEAVPGDCSDGIVCVVLFHADGDAALDGARGPIRYEKDDGIEWEEKLLYEGAQIAAALEDLSDLSPGDSSATALAVARGAQDVCP